MGAIAVAVLAWLHPGNSHKGVESSKKDLWRIARAEGYSISYPRFVRKVNEVIERYNLRLER